MKKIKNSAALARIEAARDAARSPSPITIVPSPAQPSEPAPHPRDLDVAIEMQPRVAGVEKGRIFNHWLECFFEIRPMKVGDGFEWSARFTLVRSQTGLGHAVRTFVGVAKTRALAKGALMDAVTKHIQYVNDDRQMVRQIAPAPISEVRDAANKGAFALRTLARAFADLMRALARGLLALPRLFRRS